MEGCTPDELELLERINAAPSKASPVCAMILTVNNMLKKPSMDISLSQVLHAFLEYLSQSNITLQAGIFSINFAEAALLVQASAQLYSKKVDMLWDFIVGCQERIASYEEKTEENTAELLAIEERKNRYKRKRKVQENTDEEIPKQKHKPIILSDNPSSIIYKKVTNQEIDLFFKYGLDVNGVPDLPGNKARFNLDCFKRWSIKYHQYTENTHKPVEKINPVRSHFNYVVPLTENVERFRLKRSSIRCDIKEYDHEGDLVTICDYGQTSMNTLYQSLVRGDKYFQHYIHNRNKFVALDNMEALLDHCFINRKMSYKLIRANLDTLFEDYRARARAYPSRISMTKKQLLNFTFEPEEEDELSKMPVIPNKLRESRKTIDSRLSDVDSGFFSDANEQVPENRLSRATSLALSEVRKGGEVHPIVSKTEEEDSILDEGVNVTHDVLLGVDNECKEVNNNDTAPKRSRKRNLRDDDEEKLKKQKKIKTAPVTTASLKSFEEFVGRNYEVTEGEGVLVTPDIDDSDAEDQCEIGTSTSEPEVNLSEPLPEGECSAVIEPAAINNENAQEIVTPDTDQNQFDNECSILDERYEKYTQWKRFIVEKLEQQKGQDFDIHEEGTSLITQIGAIGATAQFKDVVKNKPAKDVCRSFIAMLQLANSNNVEITNVVGGHLANDTLKLKLISTERHHEKLEQFSAPSEESYQSRMEAAQKMLKRSKSNVCHFKGECKRKK